MTSTEKGQQAERVAVAFAGAGFVPASTAFDRDGRPVRRFLKDLISAGTYRHPAGAWTLEVTAERMDRWTAAFNRMRFNGVDVEVVVDHRLDAGAVRGYLVEMFRWGDTLYGVHELIGEEAIGLAGTVKNVSVLIENDFRDGQGRSYGEAIAHSSIVQQPLVPGQQGFVPIAASRGGAPGEPVAVLSAASQVAAAKPGPAAASPPALNAETLAELRRMLGEDVTAETALPAIQVRLADLSGRLEKLAAERPALVRSAEELRAQVEELQKRLDAARPPEIDPESLEVLAEGVESRIDGLVDQGRLAPAAAAMARQLLVGPPGRRCAVMLSRRAGGAEAALARRVLGILEANEPVHLGERTGCQAVALARIAPGQAPADHDPAVTRAMIASAGG